MHLYYLQGNHLISYREENKKNNLVCRNAG